MFDVRVAIETIIASIEHSSEVSPTSQPLNATKDGADDSQRARRVTGTLKLDASETYNPIISQGEDIALPYAEEQTSREIHRILYAKVIEALVEIRRDIAREGFAHDSRAYSRLESLLSSMQYPSD